jgi:phosphate:Na+ symporter
VELGIILTDYITNCERVSDHCSNVGVCIIQTKNSSFETHGYLNEVKYGGESEFVDEFDSYQEKYRLPAVEPAGKKKIKKGKDKDKATKDAKAPKETKASKDKDSKVKAKSGRGKAQKA